MQRAAAELDPGGSKTNHPEIDFHLEDLRKEIDVAVRMVEADPPNYYLAASLAGACVHCHGHEGR